MVHQHQVHLRTRTHGDMHDLTDELRQAVARSKVQTGVAHVFSVGSTAAVGDPTTGRLRDRRGRRGPLPTLTGAREIGPHTRSFPDLCPGVPLRFLPLGRGGGSLRPG